jgi:hypothetical protein
MALSITLSAREKNLLRRICLAHGVSFIKLQPTNGTVVSLTQRELIEAAQFTRSGVRYRATLKGLQVHHGR